MKFLGYDEGKKKTAIKNKNAKKMCFVVCVCVSITLVAVLGAA